MSQRIIGIDPGYERVGIAVIEKEKKEKLIFSTCIITDRKNSPGERLLQIGTSISEVIDQYKPEALAIETLFFNSNQKTVMLVSAARGVIMYEASRHKLPIIEYTPLQVKIAVAGYGRADKKQVITMLEKLVVIPDGKRFDDEYDAIAVALTHSACFRFPQKFSTVSKYLQKK